MIRLMFSTEGRETLRQFRHNFAHVVESFRNGARHALLDFSRKVDPFPPDTFFAVTFGGDMVMIFHRDL